jgi:hypothetical protein
MKKDKFKVGDECKFLGCRIPNKPSSSYSGCKVGDIVTITEKRNSDCGSPDSYFVSDGTHDSGWVYIHEIELLVETIENIQLSIEEKEKELESLKLKLEFINKYGLKCYNAEEFKAYEILKVLGIDDIEKAKKIVEILK